MKKVNNVLWGIVFVILGVVVLLNSLEITNINIFFNGWWTLFIIVPCFIDLFKSQDKTGNFIGIIIGVLLLLGCNDLIDFDILWKMIVPIILVGIGISLIFKDSLKKEIKDKINDLNNKNNGKEYCATFSGQDLSFQDEDFNGCELSSIFGGIKCDLRNAKIKKENIINCIAIFGGITIIVPKDVNVKVVSTSIFGGVDGKNKDSSDAKNTIYINATCLFGGVEIK